MRGMAAIPLPSCLCKEEVGDSWVYMATGMSTDKSDGNSIWELWNVRGGAAAYHIDSGNWYMVNGDKWDLIGRPEDSWEVIDNNSCMIKRYSYWRLENDIWNVIQGHLERDEVIEKTEGKTIH